MFMLTIELQTSMPDHPSGQASGHHEPTHPNLGPILLMIFAPKIQFYYVVHFAVIHILIKLSPQNFAYPMTAVLLWHVQNSVVITLLEFVW